MIRRATLAPEDIAFVKDITTRLYPGRDVEKGRRWLYSVITDPKSLVLLGPDSLSVSHVWMAYGLALHARVDILAAGRQAGLSSLKMLRIIKQWAADTGASELTLGADTGFDLWPLAKRLGAEPTPHKTYRISLRG